ncbi:GNAT family N-acetyltransferase [Actinomycetospora termitidis]|uniref:GNAT family N-acetyltransferase n=1 Tax=Actinomycetospora termitidis TaxID=3053470 RepID=A0ABT7MA91_9PSEU|nr:GNAT family N-acetyltransferase [Actinomycetospora sp. Odt1-22]MDL5156752.1 GNAT family N-acetyltransferase [Actinomycetospora sp. Odt1-22]
MTVLPDGRSGPVVIDRLRPEHVGEALTVQYAAFLSEGRLYGSFEIPPLTETAAELAADLARPDTRGWAAWTGSRLVGSVRLHGVGGPAPIGFARCSVAPDVQGRGIGTALIAAAHADLATGVESALVTGERSAGNLALYARHGYVESGREFDAAGVAVVRMWRVAP